MPPRQGRYQPARDFHVVVLGAGKSCLTAQFVHNQWIESYDPTIEDSYRAHKSVDGRQVVLEILDTAGTEQFVAMRDLYMKAGQGFLLVFSIISMGSFNELKGLRDEIIRIKDDPKVPIVICGNKADLDTGEPEEGQEGVLDGAQQRQQAKDKARQVPRKSGFGLSQQWDAPYYEASAKTRSNVDEVFIDLSRQMLRRDDAGENYLDDETGNDPYTFSYWKGKRKIRREQERDRDPHRPKCVIL